MSRQHADNLSHPGHYLVDPYTWPWSPKGHGHGHEWPTATPLCAMSIGPAILRYSYFKIWPWKSMVKVMCVVKGQGHIWPSNCKGQGQTHWSHLRPGVQLMLSFHSVAIGPLLADIANSYLTLKIQGQGHGQGQTWWSHLRPWVQSICLLFVSWQSDHFWLRYSKFHIWPWKFKVKIMAKVKPDGHIWALEFNRYVCFSFRGNWTIFGWDNANSIFDLKFKVKVTTKIDQNVIR